MPATLRLTGSGVNAVGGGNVETRNQSSAGRAAWQKMTPAARAKNHGGKKGTKS